MENQKLVLQCNECDATYSTTPADYFLMAVDTLFRCACNEDATCRLVLSKSFYQELGGDFDGRTTTWKAGTLNRVLAFDATLADLERGQIPQEV